MRYISFPGHFLSLSPLLTFSERTPDSPSYQKIMLRNRALRISDRTFTQSYRQHGQARPIHRLLIILPRLDRSNLLDMLAHSDVSPSERTASTAARVLRVLTHSCTLHNSQPDNFNLSWTAPNTFANL